MDFAKFIVIAFITCNLIRNGSSSTITLRITPEDNSESQNESQPSIIEFPMLKIFSNSSNPGIHIKSHSTYGYTGDSTKYKYSSDGFATGSKVTGNKSNSSRIQTSATTTEPPIQDYFSNDIDAELEELSPPPYYEIAKMARYIVANSNWTSMSTISTRDPIKGFPFSNIVSLSDGAIGNSTGVPYFYLTPLDLSVIDLKVKNRTSLSMTLAQGDYCKDHEYDTQDPRCARVILTGSISKIPLDSDEEILAKNALFSRHAEMSDWPKDHGFFCAKLNIISIMVLDYFGGAKSVPVDEYFNVNPY